MVTNHTNALWKTIKGLEFKSGEIDLLQLRGGVHGGIWYFLIYWSTLPGEGKGAFTSHLVAPQVLVIQSLEPFPQLFTGDAVGDVGGQLGILQDFIFHKDG